MHWSELSDSSDLLHPKAQNTDHNTERSAHGSVNECDITEIQVIKWQILCYAYFTIFKTILKD